MTSTPYKGTDKLILGIVLAVLNFWLFAQTTLNIAPAMRDDLGISESLTNIAISITALFSGIFIVVAGSLADRLGRVRLTYIGIALGAFGSFLIAVSPAGTTVFLMVGRVFQGLSAACIMPATLALMKAYFDGKERQRALSYWSIGSWGGSGGAALFGGFIASSLGWRWIFWISILVSIISFLMIKGTPESKAESDGAGRFDWAGFAAFIIAMVAVNIVIGQGAALGWANPVIVALAALFIIAAVAFLKLESGSKNAFVDLSLFKNKTYSGATLSNFLVNGAAGTLLVALALVQQAAGFSSLQSGLLTVGYLIAILSTIRVGEKLLQKMGARKPMLIGCDHSDGNPADNLHLPAGEPVYDRGVHRIHTVRSRTRLLCHAFHRRGPFQRSRREGRRGFRHLQDGLITRSGVWRRHLRCPIHGPQ